MTIPRWLIDAERLLVNLDSWSGAEDFIAASPDNQRKLISALKVALEALEKYSNTYRPGDNILSPPLAQVARSEIQKIGEKL